MKVIEKIKNLLSSDKGSQNGFSLFELLVSMVLFLVVTSSIYGLLNMSKISRDRSSKRTDVLKNARAAIHLIGRDALNAGLGYHQKGAIVPDDFLSDTLDIPVDADDERDILTAVIAGDDLFTNDLAENTTDKTDTVAFAYRDLDFYGGDAITLNDSSNDGGPTSTRLYTNNIQAREIKKYDLLLIESDSSQMAIMATDDGRDNDTFDIKPPDPIDINLPYNGTGIDGTLLKKCSPLIIENCTTFPASLKKFNWVSYKVKQDGTLIRTVHGNNTGGSFDEQVRIQPLAYNVKNLQFSYLLADGTVTENPSAGPDGISGNADDRPNDFNLIRQITVSIEVQSTELDVQTKKPEIIKLDARFSLRNLQYDIG